MTKGHIEIETNPKGRPSKVYTNYARARWHNRPVIFAPAHTEQKSLYEQTTGGSPKSLDTLAKDIHDLLTQPVREITEQAVLLNNTTQSLVTDDGLRPVLPPAASQAKWYLYPEGTLRLEVDGTVYAEGSANESVSTFDFKFVKDQDGQILSEGQQVIDGSHSETTADEWILVHPPHVPMDIHYLSQVTIYYKDGDDLQEWKPKRQWDRNAENKTERYEGGIAEFVDRYIIEKESSELPLDEFRTVFRDWFRIITDCDPPKDNMIGIASPFDKDEDYKRREGNRFLKDRTWVYPRNIVSPDLPFIE